MKRRILAFFIVLVLAGFTVGMKIASSPALDRWLRDTIVQQARKHLGVQLELGQLERNITLTSITLTDVTLKDLRGTGDSLSVSRLAVTIDPYAFFRGKILVRDLKLEGMFLNVVRGEDGTISVEPLFPFWQTREGSRKKAAKIGFEIGDVAFLDVDLSYRDRPAGVNLELDDVVIFLVRKRYDPPDKRTISIGAKAGTLGWKVFPEGRTVAIDTFSGQFSINPDELRVSKLAIHTGPLSLQLSGNLPFTRGSILNGDLKVDMDIGKLPWLIAGSEGLVSLTGNVGGDLSTPSFRGQLNARDLGLAGRKMDGVNADVFLDSKGCSLRDGKISYKGEQLLTEIDLSFQRNLPFTARVRVQEYQLGKLLEEIGARTELAKGLISADLTLKGLFSGGSADISMEGGLQIPVRKDALRTLEFDLSGRYQGGGLQDLLLEARSGGMRLVMAGSLSAAGPRLTLDLADENLENWREIPGLEEFGGSLVLNGVLKGSWEDPTANLDVEFLKPSWSRFRGDLVQAHLDVDRSGLNLPMLTVKKGAFTASGRASLPFRADSRQGWVNVSVNRGPVEDLLEAADLDLEIGGDINGNLYAFSTAEGWKAEGTLSLLSGRILQEPFDEINIEADIEENLLTVHNLMILKGGSRLEGSGSMAGDEFQMKIQSREPVRVEEVQYLGIIKVPLAGQLSLSGVVSGKRDGSGLRARAELEWDQLIYEGRSWGSGKGTFLFRGPELEAKADLLDGKLSATAKVTLRSALPFSGKIFTPATIDRVGLNNFLGLGIPGEIFSGNMAVDASASGLLTDVRKTQVEGIISDADFTIKGIQFNSVDRVPFNYYPETGIRFTKLPLRSGGSVINGNLRIAPDAGIEGALDGSIDLEGLAFLKPTVDTFSGQAMTQLKVTGSLSEPILNGSIELDGTECVAHLPFDLPISDVEGKLEIVGNRLHIGEIRGRPEGGRLWMSGELFMSRFKPYQGSLQWKAEAVPISFPEGLETVNRADLGLKFSGGKGFLRGILNMDRGTYNREIDLDNLIALIGESRALKDEIPSGETEKTEGGWLNLDVEMVTASPIVVNMKLIRGEASGNLHLRGTAAAPVLTGRLEMTQGTIEYRGHAFEVTGGTVAFINPKQIEPNFDFSGRTEVTGFDREGIVTDYTVELIASGIPEKFELDLVSSPVLSEADIVALLTWGAVGEQAFASGAGLSAAEATLLLTRELKGKLETEVEKVTGFDRFTINPSAVSSSGERTARIQIDKKLSDKFYLTYSTPVLASEEQEVLVKYRITKSLSLVGEQLGERDYGLDLDFQFEIQ